MIEDYKAARKMAEDAVRKAVRSGTSPYLPVLDALEEVRSSAPQTRLGVLELPLSRIKGNKELARNNAFANNFMPLLETNSEFAMKWSDLYDSYKQEGIRDAIKVYEYMNRYYVQEGNKRVSVSHFGGTEYIMADVIRILPEKNDSKESRVYYEYLDFYKVTQNYLIVFTEPGSYDKLAKIMGQDLENEWPTEARQDLKSAFYRFTKCLKSELGIEDEFDVSDNFLLYCMIFPLRSLLDDTDKQILKNIELAKAELISSNALDSVEFLADTPEVQLSAFQGLFSAEKRYTASAPLRVAFIYDMNFEDSRWTDSHEAGRLYVDEVTDKNVVTRAYTVPDFNSPESVRDTIEQAVKDKNELIFTINPGMMEETVYMALHYPKVRFLNCNAGLTSPSVRCYQAKLHEGSFLMGVLAAETLLFEGGDTERRIGYAMRDERRRELVGLNAFAIGASMIDPSCKVVVKTIQKGESIRNIRDEWAKDGVRIYADLECAPGDRVSGRQGLYWMDQDKDVYMGASFFNWGKFYARIVQSVLSGGWDRKTLMEKKNVSNYWFGLATGVVDIRTKEFPYQTEKLLAFFRQAIIKGEMDPFSGEIHTRDGKVIRAHKVDAGRGGAMVLSPTPPEQIFGIDWINENIEGEVKL